MPDALRPPGESRVRRSQIAENAEEQSFAEEHGWLPACAGHPFITR
jgi:hypothetical protein